MQASTHTHTIELIQSNPGKTEEQTEAHHGKGKGKQI